MVDSLAPAPVHKASLVDPSLHSPALLQLVKVDLSRSLIEYIVDCVVETVDYALGRPSSSRGRSLSRHSEHTKFTAFVTDLIQKAEVQVPSLLVTLVYIQRAKPHLQIALEQWACERVFLGALIVSNKYLNDSTLKNVHWALCTGIFGKRDIGRIEREFLDVLDFELGVNEADLLAHHPPIMAVCHPHHHVRSSTRSSCQSIRLPQSPCPSRSRWSTDSSDMDVDSDGSSEPISSPRTPEDAAPLAPTPVKLAGLGLRTGPAPPPQFIALPTPSQAHVAQTHVEAVYLQHDTRQQPHNPPQPQHHHHHQRLSSALQLLHSLPIPYFNSRSSSSQPQPQPQSALSTSRRASIGCRPMQHSPIAVPSAAYAPQVLV